MFGTRPALLLFAFFALASQVAVARDLGFMPNAKLLDSWTAVGTSTALGVNPASPVYPPSVRPVSRLELVRNEIFFRSFLKLKSTVLKPNAARDTSNLLDSLSATLGRVRESPFSGVFRGSVFNRLNGLLDHSALKNDAGRRDLGQFAAFQKDFKADLAADANTYGVKFFDRETLAQGAVNSFAIKLFAWMNGRQMVPDRPSVNSIALLHPLVDAAMDNGWMRPDTFGKLNAYLFEGKKPQIQDDYERVLFDYLYRFEKPFPRQTVPGFWFSLARLFATQVKSLKQKKTGLPIADYYRIALDKGGLSTVLAAYTALGPLTANQYEFFYRTGGVFQVIDDLLDITKDQAEGVHTVWTDALSARQSLAGPLAQLLSLENLMEDQLPRMTSNFADPAAFSNVYAFGFKLSLLRGLARQQRLLDDGATKVITGRLSLTLPSLLRLMTASPANPRDVEEGSDLWLFQELVQATEDY